MLRHVIRTALILPAAFALLSCAPALTQNAPSAQAIADYQAKLSVYLPIRARL